MITHRAWEDGSKEHREHKLIQLYCIELYWDCCFKKKIVSVTYVGTRALCSYRSFTHCRAAYTIIPLLCKAIFTPSIQPNLGLPCTHTPLVSTINILLAIQFSSILSTCQKHLNTLWSALLANSLSIPALLHTSSFLTLSTYNTLTKLLKHFIWRTFTFLLSALLILTYPIPLLCTKPLVLLLLHLDTCWPLSPILYCSIHFPPFSAPHAQYPSFILCTTSLSHPPSAATCDPRYLIQSTSSNGLSYSITCIWLQNRVHCWELEVPGSNPVGLDSYFSKRNQFSLIRNLFNMCI